MLTITLDESDCFAAWVSAKDAGFSSPDGSDPKRECVLPSLPPCKREGGSVLSPCAHLLRVCSVVLMMSLVRIFLRM